MLEFRLIPCPQCEGTDFTQVVKLKQKPGAGLIFEPVGYACVQCQVRIDPMEAFRALELRQKRAELKQLEEELGIHG